MNGDTGGDGENRSHGQGDADGSTAPPTVLVVDDDVHLIGLFESWLDGDYEVLTATGGDEALDELDEDVDVVLLDRRMPDRSGDDVLERIRERSVGCRVVMVTGVTPDVDIVDMEFDDYLVKPVARAEVEETIRTALKRSTYGDRAQESYALAAKKAALETSMMASELESSQEYQALVDRLDEVTDELQRTHEDLVREGTRAVIFKDVLQTSERSS
ncbi:MAG: response regulator [Haloferacaceae archaeon]